MANRYITGRTSLGANPSAFRAFKDVGQVTPEQTVSPAEITAETLKTGAQGVKTYNTLQTKKLENLGLTDDAKLRFDLPGSTEANPLRGNIFRMKSDLGPIEQFTSKWSERVEVIPDFYSGKFTGGGSMVDVYKHLKERNIGEADISNILGVDHDDYRKYSFEQDYLAKQDLMFRQQGDMPGLRQGETPFTKGTYEDWIHNKDIHPGHGRVDLTKIKGIGEADIPFGKSIGTDYGPLKRLGTDQGPLKTFFRKKGYADAESGPAKRLFTNIGKGKKSPYMGKGPVSTAWQESVPGKVIKAFGQTKKAGGPGFFPTLFPKLAAKQAAKEAAKAGITSAATGAATGAAGAAGAAASPGLFAAMGPAGWTMMALGLLGGAGSGKIFKKGTFMDDVFKIFSDARLKEDIQLVGKSPSGINVYEFKYKDLEGRYRGVLADEVPWASSKDDYGHKLVDYTKVDVDFVKVR